MALVMLLYPIFAGRASAAVAYSQNFDSLDIGSLTGQDSWVLAGNNYWSVDASNPYSLPNSVKPNDMYGSAESRTIGAISGDGYLDISFMTTAAGAPNGCGCQGGAGRVSIGILETSTNHGGTIDFPGAGYNIRFNGGALDQTNFVINNDTWYRVQFEWRTQDYFFRARYKTLPSGDWSDWTNWITSNNSWTSLDKVYISTYNCAGFFDDLIVNGNAVPPATLYSATVVFPAENSTNTPTSITHWQVNFQYWDEANQNSSTSFKLLLFVGAPALGTTTRYLYTQRTTISGFYPDDLDQHTLYIPRTVNLSRNGSWLLIASLYSLDEQISLADSSTTHFWVQGADPAGILLPPDMSSSTVVSTGCDPNASFWDYLLCKAFSPSEEALTRYSTLLDYIKNKPPIGYWTMTMSALTSNLTNASATIQFLDLSALDALTTPLKAIFSLGLWIWGLFVIFNRVRHLEL